MPLLAPLPPPAPRVALPSPAPTLPRVAVVEDNADNRLLVQTLLEELYAVTEYGTGPDAVRGIAAEPPDLVLLDISLPGMDGPEVLQHLRADARTAAVPVVALTAHAMLGDRERFLAAGFDGYVTKPIVDETILLDAIAALLVPAGVPARTG